MGTPYVDYLPDLNIQPEPQFNNLYAQPRMPGDPPTQQTLPGLPPGQQPPAMPMMEYGTDPNIPPTARNNFRAANSQYEYNARPQYGGFSKLMGALGGLVMAGPVGAAMIPMTMAKRNRQYQQQGYQDYLQALQTMGSVQNNLRQTQQDTAKGRFNKQRAQNMGFDMSGLDSTAPLGDLTEVMNSLTAQDEMNQGLGQVQALQNQAIQNARGYITQPPSLTPPTAPGASTSPPMGGPQNGTIEQLPSEQAPTFSAGASAQGYAPPRQPTYFNPDMAKAIFNKGADTIMAGPGDAVNLTKAPYDIQNTQAGTNLRNSQTTGQDIENKYAPQLIQSIINRNNRPPAGGGGSPLEAELAAAKLAQLQGQIAAQGNTQAANAAKGAYQMLGDLGYVTKDGTIAPPGADESDARKQQFNSIYKIYYDAAKQAAGFQPNQRLTQPLTPSKPTGKTGRAPSFSSIYGNR